MGGLFFKQKTAYEMRISDWSSDVCSSDLQTRDAVDTYMASTKGKPEPWLFPGRRGQPMTTRQYARLLNHWLAEIGLEPVLFGTHSLRRTRSTLIYPRTGT